MLRNIDELTDDIETLAPKVARGHVRGLLVDVAKYDE
jgi:hypothetical protein